MRIIGCDPGINGAFCVIEFDGLKVTEVDAIDLPTLGEGKQRELDAAWLCKWIVGQGADHAFLERAMAMPPMGGERVAGAASTFNFGMAYGEIKSALKISRVPFTIVMPGVWKKFFALKGGEKEAARQHALRLIPAAAALLTRKMDHQRAESMLIALWGARAKMSFPELLGAPPPKPVPTTSRASVVLP